MEDIFKQLPREKKGISIDGHLRFADDVVLISESITKLQFILQELSTASKHVGLQMNLAKIKVMSYGSTQIYTGTQALETMTEYKAWIQSTCSYDFPV